MPVLEVKKLQQVFEQGTPNENHALKSIDLSLNEGDFMVIIGGNGAGKSTLLNSIAGSLPVSLGQIKINDQVVTYQNVAKRSRLISRVFQDPKSGTAPLLTVEENLSLALHRGEWRNFWRTGVKKSDRALFREKLAQLGLGLEDRLTAEIGLLSGGQRQAITLLMATIETPSLLLLDEHTAALDPKTSEMVMELTQKIVESHDLTTLMITHNMRDALRFGNRLIMMHNGRILIDLAGREKENLTIPDLLAMFEKASGNQLDNDRMLLG